MKEGEKEGDGGREGGMEERRARNTLRTVSAVQIQGILDGGDWGCAADYRQTLQRLQALLCPLCVFFISQCPASPPPTLTLLGTDTNPTLSPPHHPWDATLKNVQLFFLLPCIFFSFVFSMCFFETLFKTHTLEPWVTTFVSETGQSHPDCWEKEG